MNPNQLKQLEKLAKVFNTDNVITPEDIAQVVEGIAQIIKVERENIKGISEEHKQTLQSVIETVSNEHDKILKEVKNTSQNAISETTEAINKLTLGIEEVKRIAKEVMEMKPENGLDADEDLIVEKVLAEIKLPEYKETVLDDGEQIRDKLTSLEGDKRLDISAIKGTDKLTTQANLDRAISILDQRTQFLVNKVNNASGATAFTSLTDVPSSYTGAGGKVVAVNVGETGLEFISASGVGTVTSVAATVPTGLTISGSPVTTSGTLAIALDTGYVIPLQTTLDGFVPYTGATTNVDLGAHNLTVDTNTFFVDSTNNRVGIGTTSPSKTLTVSGQVTVSSTQNTDQAYGINASTTHSTATAGTVYGYLTTTKMANSTGTQPTLQGNFTQVMYGGVQSLQTNVAISNLQANFSRTGISGASPVGTVSNGYGFYIDSIANQGTGTPAVTFTNQYGTYIANQGSGNGVNGLTISNATGLYVAAQSGATTKNYAAIFAGGNVGIGTTSPSGRLEVAQDITAYPTTGAYGQLELTGATTPAMRLSMGVRTDTEKAYIQAVKSAAAYKDLLLNPLGGNVGIGTTTPDQLLHEEVSDAGTNAVVFGQRHSHITSGTATTGFGIGEEYELENASGTNRVAGTNEFAWTDATNATEDASWKLKLMRAGTLTEALGVDSLGALTANGIAVPTISSTDTLSNKTLTAPKFADLGFIADANGNEMIIFDTVASAVNEITLANAATTGTPTISATGGDTNINLQLTPKGTGIVKGELKRFMVRLLANTTDTATGTTIGGDYRISNRAITVKAVGAYVDTAGTTNTTTIDINEAGTTILSTKITIDSTEKSSETAATAPVISDTAIAADAVVTFDIDAISTTPAKGLTVWVDYIFS